ncbi:LytR/AlgR family response regulator transcription factor [Chitinophaga tropicalis]|uniref:Response regulator n=1 Tax=Chitinophaga tropicalis TaxID=2683588 RepID=A0A7K1U067_9BACT|nr:LytTR family DNA-binding domain-containing protein [Chitinophaga tropicalis]MVT07743.1 response regulator [Chitinophaga tropicalis]
MYPTEIIKTIIVDDQTIIQKDVETLVQTQPGFIVIGTCGTVKDAQKLIELSKPNLVLLDINLEDGTAFDLLVMVPPEKYGYKVIFLTAHQEHAIKAIKLGALDYLLKPLDAEELQTALQKVSKEPPAREDQLRLVNQYRNGAIPSRIALRSQQFLQVVEIGIIKYCQSDSGYTTFYLSDGRKIVTSYYIKEYEEILPESQFLRTHQSFLVNTVHIDRYYREDGYILLKDGTKIIVSDRRKEFVTKFLTTRL